MRTRDIDCDGAGRWFASVATRDGQHRVVEERQAGQGTHRHLGVEVRSCTRKGITSGKYRTLDALRRSERHVG